MSDDPLSTDASVPPGLAEPSFDPNAMRVLNERYFAKKADGSLETPREFLWRVASAIAGPEEPYARQLGRDPEAVFSGVAHAFYDMMARRDFMPNTPCLVNAGRPLSMLSACFVLPVPDSIEGIFYNLKAMALIQKSGGGCVSADSRVWTTFCGLEPIEVLFNRATADGRPGFADGNGVAYDVRDLGIRTVSMDPADGRTGLRNVTHVWKFDVPAESQVVVRTREGTEVQTSAWHPFMVLRGREFVEVRADELSAGDLILGPERPDAFWPWTEYRTVAGLPIDERIAWLIGFTLGNGSFGYVPSLRQERLRWFSGATDVLDRVREILREHDINVGMAKDPRGNTHYVTTLNQEFVTSMLAACGFAARGPKDQRIRVPEHIAKSPLSVVRAFVAGLLDSDGTVDRDGSPSYTTVSTEMARDLAALMSLLGYRSTLKRKEPRGRGKLPTYTVLLCPLPQVNELAEDVARCMAGTQRRERLHSDGHRQTALAVPFAPWRDALYEFGLVQDRGTKGEGPLADELNRWSCIPGGRVRRDDLTAVAETLAAHDPAASELLSSLARRGQEIASVSCAETAMPYYDLTVDEWNTYASGRTGLALIHNTGFAFSELRHQGAEVESTGKDASGPVSFMKVFNSATDSIKQGGVRRGANMGVLRVDHPDVFQFMRCKKELDAENRALWNRLSDCGRYSEQELAHVKQELLQTQINNFNISIGVTDEFMKAVENDADFALRDPRSKEVVRTVKAREIWDGMVEGAWQNGEPGELFLDHPEANPLHGLGPIQATNPCVTGGTWVHTFEGPRQVKDLVGKPFGAIVDGEPYASTEDGFFFTGVKAVVRLETDRGVSVTATPDHKIMTVATSGKREWKPLGELRPGDRVAIHQHERFTWDGTGTFEDGVLLGSLVGDGHFHDRGEGKTPNVVLSYWGEDAERMAARSASFVRQRVRVCSDFEGSRVAERGEIRLQSTSLVDLAARFGITPESKHLSAEVEAASYDFYRGFLQGWFDADGTVGGSLECGFYTRLTSNDLNDLSTAQRMLNRLGIESRIYRNPRKAGMRELPDGKGGKRHYACSAYHELSIPWRSLKKFQKVVGFAEPKKARKLANINADPGLAFAVKPYAVVREIVDAGFAPVYDCTIPGPHAFDANNIYVKNCGEQFLHGYDSCNLGSINVGHFYDAKTKDADWERLAQATTLAIRFLDNVIDANVYPLTEIEAMVKGNRRVGLGIMGFAELLIKLEIAYGSSQAIEFAAKLMKFIQQRAVEASDLLARERGDFPNKHLSTWAGDPKPRRNAALLSIAPTGTISMIAGCSFGCEPYFGMAYTKHVMKDAEGRPQHLYYVVPLFEHVAKAEGFFSDELLGEIENNRGSLKGLAAVPNHWQEVFTTSADVSVDQHIDMLAAFQKYTCNAVSKTINAPNDDTRENVSRAIFRAYKSGCKGFTYYRDGSRTEQVVTFSKDGDLKSPAAPPAPPAPATAAARAQDELDIDELLAKANALLEAR
ncbi:MAG: LAGLIDADG family homing endonuclease [Vulcanimicrobiaceae bacterium]